LNSQNAELREIWKYFDGYPYVFLATVERDQPRVRPVTLVHFKNRLYFTTGSGNAKVKQVMENSKIEFCLLFEKGERKGTIRVECLTRIVQDRNTKADIYNNIPFAEEFWESPEDPNYTVVALEPKSIEYMKPGSIEATEIKL
jgi:general stress protein 26